MTSIILSKNNPQAVLRIPKEAPFCRITSIKVNAFQMNASEDLMVDNQEAIQTIFKNITIKHLGKDLSGRNYKNTISLSDYDIPSITDPEVKVNYTLEKLNEYDTFELEYINPHPEDLEIEIFYENKNHHVSIEDPFIEFAKHIELKDNVKILFSAPFGQGKSTFLDIFFKDNKYNVFNLFPVNYAVSHNEDIFKYIKAEILFQLLVLKVPFDKESFSYFKTAPLFFLSKPANIIAPLAKLFSQIDRSVFEVYNEIRDLANEYFTNHDSLQIDDEKKAKQFIKEIYENEGSIFEDNFYTQLIRQQLEKHKTDTGQQNVLIIDDLDRMDPDHIFRILNVFAAHFDSQHNGEYSNKFGFDKIILVGDYNNLKNIFEYRYGSKVEFGGYIGKYYSREPFLYDNKKAIALLINSITKEARLYNDEFYCLNIIESILTDLVASEYITLRELIKLHKYDAVDVALGKTPASIAKNELYLYTYFNVFYFLSKVFDFDMMIQKFEKCKAIPLSNKGYDYQRFTELGVPSLVHDQHKFIENKKFNYNLKLNYESLKTSFEVKIQNGHGYSYYYVNNLKKEFQEGLNEKVLLDITFTKADFYDILILNVQKYKQVGGFAS